MFNFKGNYTEESEDIQGYQGDKSIEETIIGDEFGDELEAPKTNLNKEACVPAKAGPKKRDSPLSTPTTKENNQEVKLLVKQGRSNKAEDSVQSLTGSSALSKQLSHIAAPKTNLNKEACVPAKAGPKKRDSPLSTPTTKENNQEVKLLVKQGCSNKAEDSVQSLTGSSALSKQLSHIAAPKTNLNKEACVPAKAGPKKRDSPLSTPTTKENNQEVKLLVKQGRSNKAEDSVQSLTGSSALSKQLSHIAAPKTNLNKEACVPAKAGPKKRDSPLSTPTTKENNQEVKLLVKQGRSNKAEDSVQSLTGSSALSKQLSHIAAPKTNLNKEACVPAKAGPKKRDSPLSTPTTKENNQEVKLLVKQGRSNKAEDSVQSLTGSSALSKQLSHIAAPKTNLNKEACVPAKAGPKKRDSPLSTPTTKENNQEVKLLVKQGRSNKAEDSVQSLTGSSALSKQLSHIAAPKTNLNKEACVPAKAGPKKRDSPLSTPTTKENNQEVKLLVKQGCSNKAEDSVQSLTGSSALSKQLSHIAAPKTNLNKEACVPAKAGPKKRDSPLSTPTTKENNQEVKLLVKQGRSNKAEDSVQSLTGSSALSKQLSHIAAPKTNLNKEACVPAKAGPKKRDSPLSTPTTKENNQEVKLLVKQGRSNKAEDSVQSLTGSSALSKQLSHIAAPKTNLNKEACVPAKAGPKKRDSPLSTPTTKENNQEVKLLVKQGCSNKAEDSVQSLTGSSALSKQLSHIAAPKTNLNKEACVPAKAGPKKRDSPLSTPTTKENNQEVKLLVKQGRSNKAEDSVQSLTGSSALSKQLSHIAAPKTNLNKEACVPAKAGPKKRDSPLSTPTTKENNQEVKLLVKQGRSNKAEDSVQSLTGSSALSKQLSHIAAPKTNLNKEACVPAKAGPKQRDSPLSPPTTKQNNKAVKLLVKQGCSNKAEDSVQSLPGSSALSKQLSHIAAPKTNLNKAACVPAKAGPKQRDSPLSTPTTKENNQEVKLLVKQGCSNKAEDSVQSLPGSSALSKQLSHIAAPKTNLNKAACVPAKAGPKQRDSPLSTPTTKENNQEVKLLVKKGCSNKAEDSVQSLPGSSALSKQLSHIAAPKTNLNKAACVPAKAGPKQRDSPVLTPTRIVYNTGVKLFVKQGLSNKAEDSVQSLPGSSALSKQPSYIEAPKTNLNKAACVPAVGVPKQQRASPVSIPSLIVYNTGVKLLGKQGRSNKAEDSVQSLPGSSELSKQLSHIEAPKSNMKKAACVPAKAGPKQRDFPLSTPTPVEYNYNEVIFFVKQAWQDVEKEKINGRLNILEYKRE